MIYSFNNYKPVVHPSSFIHPQACVTGNVIIGKNVYIGPGAALRGDWGQIIIGDGCNVQENCTIHMFPGLQVILHDAAHIGHGAVIHGAVIGHNSLVGMNAVIMDHARIGKECIIGALSFVPEGMIIPDRKIAAGNPSKIIKDVPEDMIGWKSQGTALYQKLPAELRNTLSPCEPLTEVEPGRKRQFPEYKTWKKQKRKQG